MATLRRGSQCSVGTPRRGAPTSHANKLPIAVSAALSVSNCIASALASPVKVEPLRKKALLIGINYIEGSSKWHLRSPQKEVREFRELLLAQYGYVDANIVVLTDEIGTSAEYLPTRANILREIMRFTVGSSPGDEHFFFFSGHSAQREESTELARWKGAVHADGDHTTNAAVQRTLSTLTTSTAVAQRTASTTLATAEEKAIEAELASFMAYNSAFETTEEDGHNEFVIPLDAVDPAAINGVVYEKVILDDVLTQCLILPLCPQAKLVAIFNCCYSATLLDLKNHHIRTRASRLRRFCRRFVVEPYVRFVLPFKLLVLREMESKLGAEETGDKQEDATHSKSDLKQRPNGRFNCSETLDKKPNTGGPSLSHPPGQPPTSHPLTPPAKQSLYNVVANQRRMCSGLCERVDPSSLDRQRVVFILTYKDWQMNIEDEAGESMTEAIIALLKANLSPTLSEVMHAVNGNAKRLHKQMPQMSTSKPLNLRKTFLFGSSRG